MKTLEQHNAERHQAFRELDAMNMPHANGLECPKCCKELWDSDPMIVLTSNPPQKNVHCPSCGYRGYRVA